MHILKKIYQSLVDGQEVVVATIISDSGSTPRTSGSKMLIFSDGRILGTIGGGAVEGDVIQTALDVFPNKNSIIKSYNLNNTFSETKMDLICGGQMEVLIEYVPTDNKSFEMYRKLNDAAEAQLSTICIGKIPGDRKGHLVRSMLTSDGQWVGSLQVPAKLHEKVVNNTGGKTGSLMVSVDEQQYVIDWLHPAKTIFLVGAGHVSKEIAWLVSEAAFNTIIIDDRLNFACKKRFPAADKIIITREYQNLFKGYQIGSDNYIIIVTRAHRLDKEALAQALRTSAGYIGMIGSRKKRDIIYSNLVEEGFDAADLKRVHCPIGLAIDAETPFEIAVSIVGQLIQHRAQYGRNE